MAMPNFGSPATQNQGGVDMSSFKNMSESELAARASQGSSLSWVKEKSALDYLQEFSSQGFTSPSVANRKWSRDGESGNRVVFIFTNPTTGESREISSPQSTSKEDDLKPQLEAMIENGKEAEALQLFVKRCQETPETVRAAYFVLNSRAAQSDNGRIVSRSNDSHVRLQFFVTPNVVKEVAGVSLEDLLGVAVPAGATTQP